MTTLPTNNELSSLLDLASEPLALLDARGVLKTCNERFAQLTGHSRARLPGLSVADALPLSAACKMRLAAMFVRPHEAATGTQDQSFELEWEPVNAAVAVTRARLRQVADQDTALLSVSTADRVELEGERQRARELQRCVDAAADGILVYDLFGRVIDANARCTEMLGYSRDELLRLCISDLVPDYRQEQLARSNAWRIPGDVYGREEFYRRKDGSGFVAEVHLNRFHNDNSQNLITTVRDITARKATEAKLIQSNKRLEEALERVRKAQDKVVQQERLRAFGQMASGIAHDFNNALAIILGFVDLLLEVPENLDNREKLLRYLKTIQRRTIDAADVVGRLRTFYGEPNHDKSFSLLQMQPIIERVVNITKPRWKDQALAKGVSIELLRIIGHEGQVRGQATELEELLTRVLFNAIEATERSGRITIETSNEGDSIVIDIRDQGRGLDAEERQRCFEPFFTTKQEPSSGLGLATAYGIALQHDGNLEVHSEPGSETSFRLLLPRADKPAAKDDKQNRSERSGALRVLVVDDEPMIRELLKEYLTIAGHEVHTAVNGQQGLEAFKKGSFDIVLTDKAMPVMTGDRLAVEIKKLAPGIPVVLLSGFGDIINASDSKPDDVDVVLAKPVTMQGLKQALETLNDH